MNELQESLLKAMEEIASASVSEVEKKQSKIKLQIIEGIKDAGAQEYYINDMGALKIVKNSTEVSFNKGDSVYTIQLEGENNATIIASGSDNNISTSDISDMMYKKLSGNFFVPELQTASDYSKIQNFNSVITVKKTTSKKQISKDSVDLNNMLNLFLEEANIFEIRYKTKRHSKTKTLKDAPAGVLLYVPLKHKSNSNKNYTETYVIEETVSIVNNKKIPQWSQQVGHFSIPAEYKIDKNTPIKISLTNNIYYLQSPQSNYTPVDFKDFEFYSVAETPDKYQKGYYLELTPNNSPFYNKGEKKKTLQGTLYCNGLHTNVTNSGSQFEFIWFKENTSINTYSSKYLKEGGMYWEHIERNIGIDLDSNIQEIERIAYKKFSTEINISEVPDSVRFKCVALLNGKAIASDIIKLKNLNSKYNCRLKIVDEDGFSDFRNDGKADLELKYNEGSLNLPDTIFEFFKYNKTTGEIDYNSKNSFTMSSQTRGSITLANTEEDSFCCIVKELTSFNENRQIAFVNITVPKYIKYGYTVKTTTDKDTFLYDKNGKWKMTTGKEKITLTVQLLGEDGKALTKEDGSSYTAKELEAELKAMLVLPKNSMFSDVNIVKEGYHNIQPVEEDKKIKNIKFKDNACFTISFKVNKNIKYSTERAANLPYLKVEFKDTLIKTEIKLSFSKEDSSKHSTKYEVQLEFPLMKVNVDDKKKTVGKPTLDTDGYTTSQLAFICYNNKLFYYYPELNRIVPFEDYNNNLRKFYNDFQKLIIKNGANYKTADYSGQLWSDTRDFRISVKKNDTALTYGAKGFTSKALTWDTWNKTMIKAQNTKAAQEEGSEYHNFKLRFDKVIIDTFDSSSDTVISEFLPTIIKAVTKIRSNGDKLITYHSLNMIFINDNYKAKALTKRQSNGKYFYIYNSQIIPIVTTEYSFYDEFKRLKDLVDNGGLNLILQGGYDEVVYPRGEAGEIVIGPDDTFVFDNIVSNDNEDLVGYPEEDKIEQELYNFFTGLWYSNVDKNNNKIGRRNILIDREMHAFDVQKCYKMKMEPFEKGYLTKNTPYIEFDLKQKDSTKTKENLKILNKKLKKVENKKSELNTLNKKLNNAFSNFKTGSDLFVDDDGNALYIDLQYMLDTKDDLLYILNKINNKIEEYIEIERGSLIMGENYYSNDFNEQVKKLQKEIQLKTKEVQNFSETFLENLTLFNDNFLFNTKGNDIKVKQKFLAQDFNYYINGYNGTVTRFKKGENVNNKPFNEKQAYKDYKILLNKINIVKDALISLNNELPKGLILSFDKTINRLEEAKQEFSKMNSKQEFEDFFYKIYTNALIAVCKQKDDDYGYELLSIYSDPINSYEDFLDKEIQKANGIKVLLNFKAISIFKTIACHQSEYNKSCKIDFWNGETFKIKIPAGGSLDNNSNEFKKEFQASNLETGLGTISDEGLFTGVMFSEFYDAEKDNDGKDCWDKYEENDDNFEDPSQRGFFCVKDGKVQFGFNADTGEFYFSQKFKDDLTKEVEEEESDDN